MSPVGTNRTSSDVRCFVANGGKADVDRTVHFGRERPNADIVLVAAWRSYFDGRAELSPLEPLREPSSVPQDCENIGPTGKTTMITMLAGLPSEEQ
jgi:hypothetical protein